jgi:hypothetical protein
MPRMGPDEVSFVVYEEEPEPPRRSRHVRRTAVAIAATALSLGALVSGASAVTGSHATKSLTARQERHVLRFERYARHHRGPCHHMGGGSPAGY